MAIMSIRIRETLTIKPSEPTPSSVLPLSVLDSGPSVRFTIGHLLAFEAPAGLDQKAVTERLKTALSQVLVPYYPLAGRVRTKPNAPGLEVVCEGQGAVFIEAVSEDDRLSISDFDKAPNFLAEWKKFLTFHVADPLRGDPPVVLQLTWLNDTQATLGVGINHCICDGAGSGQFLNALAEFAMSQDRVADDLNPKPIWHRHLFDPSNPPRSYSVSHPEFSRVPDLCEFASRFSDENSLTPTSITFGKGQLNELKTFALKTTTDADQSFTSFEVLAAHVWRSWARAIGFPQKQVLKFLFSLNIRSKTKPRIPEGYYGNALILGCAQASMEELTENGLGHAAMLMKKAKDRVDDDYVRSVVEASRSGTGPDSVGVLTNTQWSRIGLETVDFGMGKPVHVAPVYSDRFCFFLPVHNQMSAVRVMLAVPSSGVATYERLLKNSSL